METKDIYTHLRNAGFHTELKNGKVYVSLKRFLTASEVITALGDKSPFCKVTRSSRNAMWVTKA